MLKTFRMFSGIVFALIFFVMILPAWGVTPTEEEMDEIRACDCRELSGYYKDFIDSEKQLEKEIKNNSNNQAATNVAGVATLAVVGIGFFEFGDPNEGAKEQLEDIRVYRKAIEMVAKEKKCTLPTASANTSSTSK